MRFDWTGEFQPEMTPSLNLALLSPSHPLSSCDCPTSGCCEQEGVDEIPGNFFYRMIGPDYRMRDPLQGLYGQDWRATPAGPNTDEAQYWNFAVRQFILNSS